MFQYECGCWEGSERYYWEDFIFYNFLKIYFWLCWSSLLLQVFSSYSKQRLLFPEVCRPLLLPSTGSQCMGFSSDGALAYAPLTCGIFLDKGLNSCPLNWQVDS